MLKRYIVFVWSAADDEHGGWDDVLCDAKHNPASFDTLEEAKAAIEVEMKEVDSELPMTTWQIVDLQTCKVVDDYEDPRVHFG